jgi:hypothetical protein
MRIVPLLMLVGAVGWAPLSAAADAFGTWKMNAARSTFTGDAQPKSFTLRIEPHAKGEVLTIDRIEADGRATSSSTILYLDGETREFSDFGCSGTQSSRRVDGQTVEILRKCASGESTRFVRRSALSPKELILDITEQHLDGRRFECRLVLEIQYAKNKGEIPWKTCMKEHARNMQSSQHQSRPFEEAESAETIRSLRHRQTKRQGEKYENAIW